MATDCFGSIKGRIARLTRLNNCGVPVVGAKSSLTTKGFIKVDISPTYEDGTQYRQKNADGEYCVNDRDDGVLTELGVTIDFCKVDPDAVEMVTPSDLILSGADAVGFQLGEDKPTERFALEIWSYVAGSGACSGGSQKYVYWLLPNLGNGKIGDLTIEDATLTFQMSATSKGAPNSTTWTAGATPATTGAPYDQSYLPANAAVLLGRHIAVATTIVAPPAEVCGAVALAA